MAHNQCDSAKPGGSAFSGHIVFYPAFGKGVQLGLALLIGSVLGLTACLAESALSKEVRIKDPSIRECSGIVASRTQPGVLWVHNDSGNAPELFAIDITGKTLGRWPVDARNRDWEDIALGPDGLYLGDFGNNSRNRREVHVLRVDEPRVNVSETPVLPVRRAWKLTFPGDPFDCESLFVHNGVGYLIEKTSKRRGGLYRFKLSVSKPQQLVHVAKVPVDAAITGADFDAASGRLAIVHAAGLMVFATGQNIAAVETAPFHEVVTIQSGCEACCFTSDGVLTASEDRTLRFWSAEEIDANTRDVPESQHLAISHLSIPIVIDGDLEDWADRYKTQLTEVDSRMDTAMLWVAWTDKGFHLAGSVPDYKVTPSKRAWYNGDCVEIFLGQDSPNRTVTYRKGDDRCYIAFVRDEHGSLKAGLFWPRHSERLVAGAICAARTDKEGYRFEVFLPWPEGWPVPTVNTSIRFACSILSSDPRRNWYIGASNRQGVWSTPLLWAIGTLDE